MKFAYKTDTALPMFLMVLVSLCTGCSATKPAPIKDQSSSLVKNNNVVIPNWSVQNVKELPPSKAAPATASTQASKPAPKQAEPTPVAKEPIAIDSSFRIGKPSSGSVLQTFDGNTNKGIDYGGKIGDPVNAASDGKVIFAGNTLRSYGNLVIVKHNNSYISIYAHNNKLLVKEGDQVRRGQKIAEMGNTESDRVKLHFELRRDSKPIDPSGYFDS
jgi:lipoprotein NlpD